MIKEERVKIAFESFSLDSRWEFANNVLYQLCEKYPTHDNEDIVVAKIWLIGRSYAAAIERFKDKSSAESEDFYYEEVAPKMIEKGEGLDSQIRKLKQSQNVSIVDILSTHKYLLDAFESITKHKNRSLASKYLHFHCPEHFYIYDSRADSAVKKFVDLPNEYKKTLYNFEVYDSEYANFVCRMMELREYIHKTFDKKLNPRQLDSFLLFVNKTLK